MNVAPLQALIVANYAWIGLGISIGIVLRPLLIFGFQAVCCLFADLDGECSRRLPGPLPLPPGYEKDPATRSIRKCVVTRERAAAYMISNALLDTGLIPGDTLAKPFEDCIEAEMNRWRLRVGEQAGKPCP